MEERPYLYGQIDNKHFFNKHSAPVPPSSLSLLETSEHQRLAARPRTIDARSSLLLDANDELGMQLLISSATIDCQDYKVLSFEEVERLKRERTLLANRIDAQTRKLALESKVRDASHNLVKLHANRNKRMSKQAEDQLANATRKVDDLATDLWRLQRREAAIKQQLLEHLAGVLARSVSGTEAAKRDVVYQDFDDNHLYRDANLTARTSLSGSYKDDKLSRPRQDETVVRAEARLRDTNVQLRNFLSNRAAQQDEDDEADFTNMQPDLEVQLNKLDNSLLAFQEQHLEHKERTLRQLESQANVLQRLWSVISPGQKHEFDPADLEEGVKALLSRLQISQRELEKHKQAHNTSLEAELSELRATHQQEADKLHRDLQLRQQSELQLSRDLAKKHQIIEESQTTITMHDAQLASLQKEVDQAKDEIERLTSEQNVSSNSAERALITRLEEQIAELQETAENSRSVGHSELLMHADRIEELEQHLEIVTSNHDEDRARLLAMTQQFEAHQRLSQESLEKSQAESYAARQAHESTTQQLAAISSKRDVAVMQIAEHKNALNDMEELISKLKNRIQELEHDSVRTEEQNSLIADLQREVLQVTTEKSVLAADLESLRGSHQDIEHAQVAAAKDALVRELDTRIETLEAELTQIKEANAHLKLALEESQIARSVSATPIVQQGRFSATDDEAVLEARCKMLQHELLEMLNEYEAMTQSALLYENERTRTENKMDDLMDRVLDLEAQLSDEKVKNLGMQITKTKAGDANVETSVESTTAQLRKDFRRLVQEMRSEHAKQTREDYTEIKRLEKQIVDLSQSGRSGSV